MAGKHTSNSSGNKLIILNEPEGKTAPTDSFTEESQFLEERWSPGSVGTIHRYSDLDSAQIAQHHTLGPRHNQAAPGDHSHNGVSSKALGIWQTYSPNWLTPSGGANPGLGNGKLTGRYMQIGGTVFGRITFNAGSSTTFGGGNWMFSLPPVGVLIYPPEASTEFEGGAGWAVCANGKDTSTPPQGTTPYSGTCAVDLWNSNLQIVGQNGMWSSTFPFNWGATSGFQAMFMYEASPVGS